MVAEAVIQEAVRRLLQAAPGATVILFGSYARGQPGPDSDLDFIVVEPQVRGVRKESARLRAALEPLPVPADVLVIGEADFREWSSRPGTVWRHALREGRRFRDEP